MAKEIVRIALVFAVAYGVFGGAMLAGQAQQSDAVPSAAVRGDGTAAAAVVSWISRGAVAVSE
jgi:hypothetical protein